MSHDQFAVLFLVTDMLNYFSYLFSLLSYSHVSCQNTWHRLQRMKKKKEKKIHRLLHVIQFAHCLLRISPLNNRIKNN